MSTYSECMILDDEEMEVASKKIDWRGKNSFEVRSLFAPIKPATEFPKAFQNFRTGVVDLPPTEFPSLVARPHPIAAIGHLDRNYRQALLQGKEKSHEPPNQFRPLVEMNKTIDMTPESIAEFGVALLPLPPFENPYVDEDGDYRYAACTPPPERVQACEAH